MTEEAPFLPPDLEREIFEITATLHPSTAPVLLRVARRALSWIEPLLYRNMDLQVEFELGQFLDVASAKPSLLSLGVRQVILPHTPLTGSAQKDIYAALRLCHRIERFAIGTQITSPDLLEILETLEVRRFAGALRPIFPVLNITNSTSALNSTRASLAFRFITHVEVFDDLTLLPNADLREFVLSLPALTHLAKNYIQEPSMIDGFLSELPQLKIFAVLWDSQDDNEIDTKYFESVFHDPRIVMCKFNAWYDAILTADAHWWRLAEDFVARKSHGEIPANVFWIED
ncbi:hypothetical protein C8F01DRAFT_1373298 [Mycena amicta]|nr:hypothetical protein C8F01DRAFT_1373298 [Mycena amicta]